MTIRLMLACCVVVLAGCECGVSSAPPAAREEASAAADNVAPPPPSAPAAAAPAAPLGGARASAEARAEAPMEKARRAGDGALRAVEAVFDGDSLIVVRNGARRISCSKACALEDQCGFRDDDACAQASCDGDVRTVARMDYCLARDDSVTCLDAARCSCNESCWKRGECAKDHANDAECERACVTLVQQDGVARYRENRCVLEHACTEIAACGAL